jgi:hypothetical protein
MKKIGFIVLLLCLSLQNIAQAKTLQCDFKEDKLVADIFYGIPLCLSNSRSSTFHHYYMQFNDDIENNGVGGINRHIFRNR